MSIFVWVWTIALQIFRLNFFFFYCYTVKNDMYLVSRWGCDVSHSKHSSTFRVGNSQKKTALDELSHKTLSWEKEGIEWKRTDKILSWHTAQQRWMHSVPGEPVLSQSPRDWHLENLRTVSASMDLSLHSSSLMWCPKFSPLEWCLRIWSTPWTAKQETCLSWSAQEIH